MVAQACHPSTEEAEASQPAHSAVSGPGDRGCLNKTKSTAPGFDLRSVHARTPTHIQTCVCAHTHTHKILTVGIQNIATVINTITASLFVSSPEA